MPHEPAKDDDERRTNTEKCEEAFKKVMQEAGVDEKTPFLDDEAPKMCVLTPFLADTNRPVDSYASQIRSMLQTYILFGLIVLEVLVRRRALSYRQLVHQSLHLIDSYLLLSEWAIKRSC